MKTSCNNDSLIITDNVTLVVKGCPIVTTTVILWSFHTSVKRDNADLPSDVVADGRRGSIPGAAETGNGAKKVLTGPGASLPC
jgi:hypothetical protein